MPRINENDIKTNYVEGEILSNTEVNAHNTLFLAGINANFDEIEKIKNGETVTVTSPDQSLKFVRLNSDKIIEISDDGETWYATASSGHIILDESGNAYQQRGRLQFLNTTITDSGDTTVIQGIQGPQGIPGEKGDPGIQGLQGLQGPVGKTIVPSVNSAGIMSFKVMDTAIAPSDVSVRGPQGPQGPQGIQGPIGPQGLVGPQGVQGPQGPIGPQGLPGTPGTNGNDFIIKDTFNSLGALKLAYPTGYLDSDGNPYGCYVEDEQSIYLWSSTAKDYFNLGSIQGPQGPQGIQGVQGPQGPQGPQGIQGPMGGSNLPVGTITHIDDGVDVPLGWEIIDAEDSYYTAKEIDEILADITDGTTQVGDSAKLGGKSADSFYNLGVPTQTIPSGADLDNYTTEGVYICNVSPTLIVNVPTDFVAYGTYFRLHVIKNFDNNGARMQIIMATHTDIPVQIRYQDSGGIWGKWQRVAYTDNISNPNLLINGDFRVNQRNGYVMPMGIPYYAPTDTNLTTPLGTTVGASNVRYVNDTYCVYEKNGNLVKTSDCIKGYVETSKYSFDGYILRGTGGTATLNDDGTVTLNSTKEYWISLDQRLEDKSLIGKTVTLSCCVNDKLYSITGTYSTTQVVKSFGNQLTLMFIVDSGGLPLIRVSTQMGYDCSVTIKYIKLELGNVATPYSPRPYGEELALCQRYYLPPTKYMITVSSLYIGSLYGVVDLPCNLRNHPTIISYEITSIRGNGKSLDLSNSTIAIDTFYGNKLVMYFSIPNNSNVVNETYLVTFTMELSSEL